MQAQAGVMLVAGLLLTAGAAAQDRQVVSLEGDAVHQERFTTGPEQQTRLELPDGSSLTLGPGADVTIDEFTFDPETRTSRLSLTARHGAMRFAGLRNREQQPVVVNTPTAKIDIDGGVNVTAVDHRGATVTSQLVGRRTSLTAKATGETATIDQSGASIALAPGQPLTVKQPTALGADGAADTADPTDQAAR